MAKLNWEIHREGGYGLQREVVANTRTEAIAKAKSMWLDDTSYENELIGSIGDDGVAFVRSPIPEFTAKKVSAPRYF